MRIGIVGPISLDSLRWPDAQPDGLPVGTTASVVAELANGLLERGHEVRVHTLSREISAPLTRRCGALTVHIAPARARHKGRDCFAVERRHLVAGMADTDCDILHAQWSYEYALASLSMGIPTLVTVRDHALGIARHQPTPHRAVRVLMNEVVLRRACHLSVTSPHLLARLDPAARAKAAVIPNLFSGRRLGAVDRDDGQPGAPDTGPTIVCVNNGFSRFKNVTAALSAFSVVRQILPSARLELIGVDMIEGGPLHRHAVRADLDAGVVFLGPLPHDRTLRHVAQAAVLLHTALEEGFCMAVLEAMALGTPVVGGAHSGNVPHLLDGGGLGVLCDVRAPNDIARAVCGVLLEPGAARILAERARRHAWTHYESDVVVPQYLEAYMNLLAASPAGQRPLCAPQCPASRRGGG